MTMMAQTTVTFKTDPNTKEIAQIICKKLGINILDYIGIDDSGGMILLNACCPIEERAKALAHEIEHLVRGDFRKRTKTVQEIEYESCIK